MKKIFGIIIMAVMAVSLQARPAYPGMVKLTQPDGSTIMVRIHGDEWGHWMTDASGKVIEMGEDGFYREAVGVTPESVAAVARIRRQAMIQRRNKMAAAKASSHVAVGQKHFLVILCAFQDKDFKTANVNAAVTSMLNDKGYSGNGATGSARDFYYASSNGYFEPIFDVYGPVTLDNNMSYYGKNINGVQGYDQHAEEAVLEGCEKLDNQIDFSQYDSDNDGYVDMVFMIYAGYGEADGGGSNTIWPHQYYVEGTFDDVNLYKYACSNELANQGDLADKLDGIGAVCHEFGHAMGLPDFYDTDYDTNSYTGGLYDFSTMCDGAYNNSSRTPPYFNTEERILLGWVNESDAYQEFTTSGSVTIPAYRPDQGQTVAYKTPTDQNGEYFVYECRGSQGWDSGIDGHGLVVYHVDKSSRKVKIIDAYGSNTSVKASELWSNWEETNSINENGKHPCFYVIPSDEQDNLDYEYSSASMVFPGSQSVTTYTAKSWNGVESDYVLSNIAYSSQKSTFNVTVPVIPSAIDYPVIANPGNGVYSAGSSFTFALEESTTRPYSSVEWYFDGSKKTSASVTLTAGSHTVEAAVKLENGRTTKVTLEITVQ